MYIHSRCYEYVNTDLLVIPVIILINLLTGDVSRNVTLAWLLDFIKAICRNGPSSQLSCLADLYLIELSVFIGISDGSSL